MAYGVPLALAYPVVAKHAGGDSMLYEARINSLKTRHARLDDQIFDEDRRPMPDQRVLMRLKLEKLRLKEEIERLSVRC